MVKFLYVVFYAHLKVRWLAYRQGGTPVGYGRVCGWYITILMFDF